MHAKIFENLQTRMAAFGFESNEDYAYQVRCLLESPAERIRCLNIEGESNRRRTAFADALARALDFPHILYHDFTQQHPPQPDVILPPSRDEQGREEPAIEPLDQILSEACAFSEGARTVLILDQLQAADFREHLRIYQLLKTARWTFRDAVYYASPRHLVVFLISEKPLYHSLQKSSFRIWVSAVSGRRVDYDPSDFGLGDNARDMLAALAELFAVLGLTPTRSEYAKILQNVETLIRDTEALRHSIFGWTEGIDRDLLFSKELEPLLDAAMRTIEDYIGVDVVEIGDTTTPTPPARQ
jgi:hypothetical protein